MVRLDINEIEEDSYDQANNINVWSELTMDTTNQEENRNGRGRMPEIYNPYTWDNGSRPQAHTPIQQQPARQQPARQQPARQQPTRQQPIQPQAIQVIQARPAISTEHDEMLLLYNVQIVNGKMRYVDPTKGITVPPKVQTQPQQTPPKAPITKSANDQCTTKQCPFKKPTPSSQVSPISQSTPISQAIPTQRKGNMFGKRVAMMPGRSKKLIM
jgi:hypothetical protein